MKKIQLTRGFVALVDDEDYVDLSAFKWQTARGKGNTWYAVRTTSRSNGKRMTVGMHRQIMDAPPDLEVDHWDHDGLNNQRKNLRLCSHLFNMANRLHPISSSGYRGVSWHKASKTWRAKARFKMKYIYIGSFDNPREAAIARDKIVKAQYGEFAILNFPEGANV